MSWGQDTDGTQGGMPTPQHSVTPQRMMPTRAPFHQLPTPPPQLPRRLGPLGAVPPAPGHQGEGHLHLHPRLQARPDELVLQERQVPGLHRWVGGCTRAVEKGQGQGGPAPLVPHRYMGRRVVLSPSVSLRLLNTLQPCLVIHPQACPRRCPTRSSAWPAGMPSLR